jgi:Protein of unknown function (DUF2510)
MTNIQPGWYQDPAGGSQKRWWDGTQWTSHTTEPYSTQAPAQVSVETNTPFVWVFAALPVVALLTLVLINPSDYMAKAAHPDLTDPFAIFTPGYFASIGLSIVVWLAAIALALLDYRVLARRGLPRPFHWAWTFLSIAVYIIGRTVIVGRRTGVRRMGPLVLFIVVGVVTVVVTFAVTISAALAAVSSVTLN